MTDEQTPDSATPPRPPASPATPAPESRPPAPESAATPPAAAPPGNPPPGAASPGTPPPGNPPPNRGLMLVLAYLWLLALVPVLVEQQDQEVRWHARHGLVLFGAEFVGFMALAILSGIVGWLAFLFWPLAQLGVLALHVACIARALQGGRLLVPGVSEYADRF